MSKKTRLIITAVWLCLIFLLVGMFAGSVITIQNHENFNASQKHLEYTYAGFDYCPKCGAKLEIH